MRRPAAPPGFPGGAAHASISFVGARGAQIMPVPSTSCAPAAKRFARQAVIAWTTAPRSTQTGLPGAAGA